MPLGWQAIVWLFLVAISVGGLALTGLLFWMTGRGLVHGLRRMPVPSPEPLVLPALDTLTVRSQIAMVATIWMALLVLVPLFVLALWALAVELTAGAAGASLLFAIVHLLLIWQLLRLGSRVQRKVDVSRSALGTHPVFGAGRELLWNSIVRVEDVKYVGPGVSGLYLYEADGSCVVIDSWLPSSAALRATIRDMTPHAEWSAKIRGFFVG